MKNLTRKDIAKAAGVSSSTVSRALSGSPLLPKTTIARVTEIAGRLGYKPNILASRLASNRSFQIGFAVELWEGARRGPIRMSYYSTILDSMVSTAFERDYNVMVLPYLGDGKSAVEHFSNLILAKHIDGIVFAGLTRKSIIPEELLKRKIPFVVIGSETLKKKFVSVNTDPYSTMMEMFIVLEKRNYRRIFFVEGDPEYYHAISHKTSFMKALGKSRLALAGIIKGDYSRSSGYDSAVKILSRKKKGDCVFFSNDRMASGFYMYCYEHKIVIPADIGVIGSDNDDSASALYPGLSTIEQPRVEMGAAAVNLLIDQLEKKKAESVVIPNSFIERKSF
jgi:DNA-binding LacI/PurR family transcriptional regulator